ncbi:MAG: restriction endonuclease [Planctomycetaceae bacterium]
MAIPNYETCMLPVLTFLKDGEIRPIKELTRMAADHFRLTDNERQALLPSGQQTVIRSRVGWAKSYLKKAGLVELPARGQVRITREGLAVLAENPQSIDSKYLTKYPSFVEFIRYEKKQKPIATDNDAEIVDEPQIEKTPDEAIEAAYNDIRNALADELLEQILECSPSFFERLVIDLLLAMGYGGAIPDAGQHLGRSGDGGIDGIINEDKLGLDIICIQAKRWKDTVGRPVVQSFAGSMESHRAKKGVMITTSTFSRDAYDILERFERKIVLIDGKQLAQLMIDYDIGVSTAHSYEIKRIDSDYFVENGD